MKKSMDARISAIVVAGLAVGAVASAQVPDVMNSLDPGGRAMGVGGSTYVTDANTFSILYNPAGLGYVSSPTFGFAMRNLPEARSFVSGEFSDPDFNTQTGVGKRSVTHLGYAFPVSGGAVGVSYTTTGYLHDRRQGTNLVDGNLTTNNYQESTIAKTDMLTISYGANRGNTNYGIGVVFANQYVSNDVQFQQVSGGNVVNSVNRQISSDGQGFGAVAGVQYTVDDNTVVGFSAQTPINITNNQSTASIYDRIPGRFSAGFAQRTTGLRSGQDFFIYSAQADYYFGGQRTALIERDNVFAVSAGFEYSFHQWNSRFPIRVGYSMHPGGGSGFTNRDTFTFGIGYRPDAQPLTVDFSLAAPTGGGGMDMSLGISYRFRN